MRYNMKQNTIKTVAICLGLGPFWPQVPWTTASVEVEAPPCWYSLSLSRSTCYLHEVPMVTTAGPRPAVGQNWWWKHPWRRWAKQPTQPLQCSRITGQHGGSLLVSVRSLCDITKGWSSKSEGQAVHAATTVRS